MISRSEAKRIWDLKAGDLVSYWPGAGRRVVFMRYYSYEDRCGQEWVGMTAAQGRGRYYTIAVVDEKGMDRSHLVCEDQLKDLRFIVHNHDT